MEDDVIAQNLVMNLAQLLKMLKTLATNKDIDVAIEELNLLLKDYQNWTTQVYATVFRISHLLETQFGTMNISEIMEKADASI